MSQEIFLRLPLFRVCAVEEILFMVEALKPGVAIPGEPLIRQVRNRSCNHIYATICNRACSHVQ